MSRPTVVVVDFRPTPPAAAADQSAPSTQPLAASDAPDAWPFRGHRTMREVIQAETEGGAS